MNSAEQTQAFCSALLGGPGGQGGDDRLEGHRAYLWTVDTAGRDAVKRTRWLRADDPDAIASAASELARQQSGDTGGVAHVYVGTGLMAAETIERRVREERRPATTMRGTNALTSGLMALAADIDLLSGVHDSKPYPPDLCSARRIYEAVPLAPTMVVHTGNGLHVWWVFAEPWLVDDAEDPDAERTAMSELAQAWSATLRCHADRLGQWKIDSTFDLARVLRVPGTRNIKENGDKPVVLEHLDLDARYEVSDFEAALVDPEVIAAYSARIGGTLGLAARELPGVDLNIVWARCNSEAYRAAGFEPTWLTDMIELMPGSTLEAVWQGDTTASGDPSPSGVDAALVRCLINTRHATTEHLVEAVMCRRLRSGEKVEKIDPRRRKDYLVRTIARIQAAAQRDQGPGDEVMRMIERRRAAASATSAAGAPRETAAPVLPARESVSDSLESPTDDEPEPEPPTPAAEPPEDDGEFERIALAELDALDEDPPPARLTVVDTPPPPDPPRPKTPAPAAEPPEDDALLWPPRPRELAEMMEGLDKLLLSPEDRKAGVRVWNLEIRDFGEKQTGRMVVRIPPDYPFKVAPPQTYRPGRPLYCSWFRREAFDVPKGFRQSLIRDAQITALPVGSQRDTWAAMIDELTPFWIPDSSGSDIVTQMHDWLVEYLVGHPAALEEMVAVDNKRAFLVDHREWGTQDKPPILDVCMPSFLGFVANQPGGRVGREAKTLVGYLRMNQSRRRMTGSDGRKRRASWYEVDGHEFNRDEWAEILESARDNAESQERRLRVVPGGRQ